MKLGLWFKSFPTEPGKYAKQPVGFKYPEIVEIVRGPDDTLLELSNGKFWGLKEGASWAKVED